MMLKILANMNKENQLGGMSENCSMINRLPLKTLNDFKQFDKEIIHNSKLQKDLVLQLKCCSSSSVSGLVHGMMSTLLVKEVAMELMAPRKRKKTKIF